MRDYASELANVATYPVFALGEEVIVDGENRGIVTSLHMPMNGLYLSPEQSIATVWFSTDRAVSLPDVSGLWVSKEFRLNELKKVNK